MTNLATFARTRSREIVVGFLFFVLAVLAPFPLWSQNDIDAGIDLWVTPQNPPASITLTIPADFFDTSSEMKTYTIPLVGEALPTLAGTPSIDRADTIIRRFDTAHLPFCGSDVKDTVLLKIVALRLRGKGPVTVTYDGGLPSELWDVRACLSHMPQRTGFLTIHRQCDQGGSFESVVYVRPKLVFTRRSDGLVRVLDWTPSPPGEPSGPIQEVKLQGSGGWSYEAPADFPRITAEDGVVTDGDCDGEWDPPLPGSTENFIVGYAPTSCSCSGGNIPFYEPVVRETGPDHEHPVDPASADSKSFPRSRDHESGRPRGNLQAFVSTLGFGVMLAALFSWRRRRSGPKE